MAKNKTVVKEDVAAANQHTVDAKPVDSKLDMLTNTIAKLSAMSKEDLNHFMQVMAQIGTEAQAIPDGTAERNQASIAGHMKEAVADELKALFDGDESLSEDFKTKVVTIFEAALGARGALIRAEIEEEKELEYNEKLSEEVERIEEAADKFMTHIAQEWLEENRLVATSELKVEAADALLEDVKKVITSHNIVIPEGKDDLVEQLVSKVEELTEALDEKTASEIELKAQLTENVKGQIFEQISEGLTESDKARFATLVEEVSFDTETYEKKLETIKEQYFTKKSAGSEELAKNMALFSEEAPVDTNALVTETPLKAPATSSLGTAAGRLFHRR